MLDWENGEVSTIVVPLFGAAILYWFKSLSTVLKIEEFKDFSRLLNDFSVLFKAYLIFKDFSRKPFKFKYLQYYAKKYCLTCSMNMEIL